MTWAFDLEEPTAFSTALLVLITGAQRLTYVSGIIVSSIFVAAVFVVWRRRFFQERARYLFQSTRGDDQILVPLRGRSPESLALFAARMAAAHEAGKVVLMETVPPETIEETVSEIETGQLDPVSDHPDELSLDDLSNEAEAQITSQVLAGMEDLEELIHQHVEVPCEFVVVLEDEPVGETVLKTASDENCDLIVCPYEADDDGPTRFVRTILSGPTDAIVFRSGDSRTVWHRILVLVRSPGDVANSMIDFAARLQAGDGSISACTCISRRGQRRTAEIMLENLVETVPVPVELRISHGSVESFLSSNGPHYDLAVIGSSTDRSVASRFLSTPTFERIDEIDCDLAIVHRG